MTIEELLKSMYTLPKEGVVTINLDALALNNSVLLYIFKEFLLLNSFKESINSCIYLF